MGSEDYGKDYSLVLIVVSIILIVVLIVILYGFFTVNTQVQNVIEGILLRDSWINFLTTLAAAGPSLANIMVSINVLKQVFSPSSISRVQNLPTELASAISYSTESTSSIYSLVINSMNQELQSLFAAEPVFNQAVLNMSENFYIVAYSLYKDDHIPPPIVPSDELGQHLFDFIFDLGNILTRVLQFPFLGAGYPTITAVFTKLLTPSLTQTLQSVINEIPSILSALGVLNGIEVGLLKDLIDPSDIPPIETLGSSQANFIATFYRVMGIALPP